MFIFGTIISYRVQITSKVSEYRYVIGVKGQGQVFLKSVLQLVRQTTLTFFDGGCLYLAQRLPMMCRLQRMFQFTNMTLKSMVKVTHT